MSSTEYDISSVVRDVSSYVFAPTSRIAIVRAQWHDDITKQLEENCVNTLLTYQISEKNISNYVVPGSLEIPFAVKAITTSLTQSADAIICIGCIIRGDTYHFNYVCDSVARGLMTLSLTYETPIISAIITTYSKEDALARAQHGPMDKGAAAAMSALEMIRFKKIINKQILKS